MSALALCMSPVVPGSRKMRNPILLIIFATLLASLSTSSAVASELISVELGIDAIHDRIVSLIEDRYELRAVETKGEQTDTMRSTSFLFAADLALRTPQILTTVGVQVLTAPGSNAGPFIAISFSAVPHLPKKVIKFDRLIEFCNRWNLSPYPIRLAVGNGHLTSLSIKVIEPDVTLSSRQLEREFHRVLQSVPRVLLELRLNHLI